MITKQSMLSSQQISANNCLPSPAASPVTPAMRESLTVHSCPTIHNSTVCTSLPHMKYFLNALD